MTARHRKLPRMLTFLAVPTAMTAVLAAPAIALAQDASDPEVRALITPTNFVQIGGDYVSKPSDKFGEYNGLYKQGTKAVGDLSLVGGDAYGLGTGTLRYGLIGTNLGTGSDSVSATASSQGKWSLGLGFDELRHELTDTYQTPFQGAVGGNRFNLPGNFGVIDTAYKPAGYKTAPGADNLTAQQLSDFHTQDIHSDRTNMSLMAGYRFNPRWDARFDFNHLEQGGEKLLGVAGDQANGVVGSTYTWAGQTPLVLPNPTDYTTNTFKFALNWAGTKAFATLGYYASIFSDKYSSLSWDNPFMKAPATVVTGTASAFPTDSISTFPSNTLNQLNLTGGYDLSAHTRIALGASYARSLQDDAYPSTGNLGLTPGGLPDSSLHGSVDIEHLDLKLTNQSWNRLTLVAGVKFNERNNKTSSNAYTYNTINEAATQSETSINAPMSNKKTQAELSGDLRISSRQHVSLGYEYTDTKRWCNNAAANTAQGSLNAASTGGWAAYSAATCVQVPQSKENKLALNYRLRAGDSLHLNAAYTYTSRKADLSPTFYNPMQAVDNPSGSGSSAEGFEVLGFVSYFEASRHEQVAKAGANWQPTAKLSLNLSGRYTDIQYTDLTYGVQKSHLSSANLDFSYSFNERRSLSLYGTYQNSSRDLVNLYKVTSNASTATGLSGFAGETWNNTLQESDTTLGLALRQDGLFSGKLGVAADVSYSLGNSQYATAPFPGTDLSGNTCSAGFYETCGSLPAIKNSTLRAQLRAGYQLNRASTILLAYTFQRLASDDFFYNAYQYGYTPATLLPTNQQLPSYNLSSVYLAYRYRFR